MFFPESWDFYIWCRKLWKNLDSGKKSGIFWQKTFYNITLSHFAVRWRRWNHLLVPAITMYLQRYGPWNLDKRNLSKSLGSPRNQIIPRSRALPGKAWCIAILFKKGNENIFCKKIKPNCTPDNDVGSFLAISFNLGNFMLPEHKNCWVPEPLKTCKTAKNTRKFHKIFNVSNIWQKMIKLQSITLGGQTDHSCQYRYSAFHIEVPLFPPHRTENLRMKYTPW